MGEKRGVSEKNVMKTLQIAVIGSTGLVGREMLQDLFALEKRLTNIKFKVGAYASAKSEGRTIDVGDRRLLAQDLAKGIETGTQVAFLSAGSQVSLDIVPQLAKQGIVSIDNSSAWRASDSAELIVPEINSHRIEHGWKKKIIANPNCSTIQAIAALGPIAKTFGLSRVSYSTYQSVSGKGQAGVQELADQTREILFGRDPVPKAFPYPIAFSLFPEIDRYGDMGYTGEEWKMATESRRILELPELGVSATCVRVPTFSCHGVAIDFTVKKEATTSHISEVLRTAPGLIEMKDSELITNQELVGKADVAWGRLREDLSLPRSFKLWTLADNLKKGASTNAVQILEKAIQLNWI